MELSKELTDKVMEISLRDHMQLLFDPYRIGNLLHLAEFLKSNEIPPPKFEISSWLSRGHRSLDGKIDTVCTLFPVNGVKHYNTCGTTACAVGHGPLAGIPYLDHETWDSYSNRCFCITATAEFAFMFGAQWSSKRSPKNNTAIGTAARIEWFLEHGVPEKFLVEGFTAIEDALCPWLEGLVFAS